MAVRNVVLIYPAARRYSGFLSAQRMPGLVMSHAGLTILAQVLERQGVHARVFDEQITPFAPWMIDGADLVGISAMSPGAPQAYRLAAEVRRLGKPVVLGGAHVTLAPAEAIEHADYVVRGEGERPLSLLVRALSGDGSLDGIAGLTFRRGGEVVHNGPAATMTTAELDELPWPRFDLVTGLTPSRYPLNRRMYVTMATRGCDQSCNFCSITRVFGQALRHRSVGSILDELASRWDPSSQFLFFLDDSLGVDRNFLKELLTALVRERMVPQLGWRSQMRADVADDPELLRLLRATNCAFVSCGFESSSDRNLKSFSKGQSLADVERRARRLREAGILLNAFFMLGSDDDGPECGADTVRWARTLGCTLAGFMPLTPYPGTPQWKRLERQGRIFTKDWELYDQQHVVIHPRRMTAWELYWRTLGCYAALYGGQNPWAQARALLPRWPAPLLAGVAVAWPIMRHLSLSWEVIANADYLRALYRESYRPGKQSFPDLSGQSLPVKDLWSGRSLRAAAAQRLS